MLRKFTDKLLTVAFPQSCHICRGPVGQHDYGIACGECWQATRFFGAADTLCSKCGVPLDIGRSTPDARCRTCEDHAYDRAAACGVYEKALSATVLQLKRFPVLPRYLRDSIEPALHRAAMLDCDVIIPVPLSTKRRTERGFNQAEVIARFISKSTGIMSDSHSLARHRHTPMHRAGMDRRAREDSVEKAFTVTRPKLVDGASVLLVDDILTSGATVSNCASVLRKTGAKNVNVFTLARTTR